MEDREMGISILDRVFGRFFKLSTKLSRGRLRFPCSAGDNLETDSLVMYEDGMEDDELRRISEEKCGKRPVKKGPCPVCPFRCPKPKSSQNPKEICPNLDTPPCCFIKMQDPCGPCCCDPPVPICPPKRYPLTPRKPICGCDYCKQACVSPKCCDRTKEFTIES